MATARAVVRATLLLCALAAAAPLAIGTEPQAASAWPACDECQGITYQIAAVMGKHVARKRAGAKARLKDVELADVYEEACDVDTFLKYKVLRVGGRIVISGPGVAAPAGASDREFDAQLSGLQRNLKKRMAARCIEVVGKVQERKLFQIFQYMKTREGEDSAATCGKDGDKGGACDVAAHSFGRGVCASEIGDCKADAYQNVAGAEAWVVRKEDVDAAARRDNAASGMSKERKRKRKKGRKKKEKLTLDKYDLNKDGKITKEELVALGSEQPEKDAEKARMRAEAVHDLARMQLEGRTEEMQQALAQAMTNLGEDPKGAFQEMPRERDQEL